MTETEITFFDRHGHRLAGIFNAPSAAPGPAVLLCQGLSGVKHLVLPEIAAGLAEKGFASMRFDYAGCGQSEGPSGQIDPPSRVEQALYAFAWLAEQDVVDPGRIGVYGHSYGGPVAICLAAREHRVVAVVAVSGPGDGQALLSTGRPAWDWVSFKRRVERERARAATTGEFTEVTVDEILPFSPKFVAAYEKLKADAGGTSAMAAGNPETFQLGSVDVMLDLHPEDAARRVTTSAVLMVHGDDDDLAAVESIKPVFAAIPATKELVVIPGMDHNDLDAGPGLSHVIELATGWFESHLS